jgi:pilus assembly protein CpaB
MRTRTALFFLMAFVFGIAAVFLARQWLQTQKQQTVVMSEDKVPLTKVVIATKDLSLGDRIAADAVKEVNWPAGSVPAGAFDSKDKLLATEPVVVRRFLANEPILAAKLAGPNARATLSAQIGETQRAVSVRVNDVVGVAGFILPGDRVDVMITRELPGDDKKSITDVLLQNIKVIGIDQNANEDASGTQVVKAVTLEVGPEQAQKLVLGTKVGELSLALRNYLDVNAVPVRTVTIGDLRYGDKADGPETKPVARRAAYRGPAGPSIVITRGTSSSNYRVR